MGLTSGDSFAGIPNYVVGASQILEKPGTKYTFKSDGISTWYVKNSVGFITPHVAYEQRKTLFGEAAPTTCYFTAGDKVYNTVPAAGGYVGWICIASGTPGTWKGFGLIQA